MITLASQSPRRRELLGQLGLALHVVPAHVDETPAPGERAVDYVRRMAVEKARAVHGELVVGADTVVVLEGEILGKPADDADAARMLRALSGRTHEVMTAVCARRGGREEVLVASTRVEFAALSDEQIAWYVETGEPRDKAGAYAVQGIGGLFVVAIAGSVSNVVGLPLAETGALLERLGAGVPWRGAASP